MRKVINPIMKKTWGGRSYRVFMEITYKDGKLSIHGVEGPLQSGNCLGSCGQIDMTLRQDKSTDWKFMKGWNAAKMRKLLQIWEEWHLNDMKAGTPEQEGFIREWKAAGNRYDYRAACEALDQAGLLFDNGYQYGTAWLKVDVPQDVIEWLTSLPNSEVEPAWV